MRKTRRESPALNPEKFLAVDTKKKSSKASLRRLISLRRVVALSDSFKEALYADLQRERPELFVERALLESTESVDVFEDFLRRAIAREKLAFSDEVFGALYSDFLHGLAMRLSDGETGDSTNEENA